jgi:hypothetical protein
LQLLLLLLLLLLRVFHPRSISPAVMYDTWAEGRVLLLPMLLPLLPLLLPAFNLYNGCNVPRSTSPAGM